MPASNPSRRAWTQPALRLLPLLAAAVAGCVSAPPKRPQPPTAPAPSPVEIEKIPDPVPRAEPRSAKGNPPFYEVLGKRYFVLEDSAGYVERGIASWYGPGFHAALTSNGERYDMYAMTAAHKTLPLPCYVQVTNLKNGKSVVVRVNDRGPFKEGRIIDLSYTAAAKLDMLTDGTTFVEVRALTPEASPSDAPVAATSGIFVQAGAFSSEANAATLLERLRAHGVQNGFVRKDNVEGRTLYRVRVGPLPSVGEFDRIVSKLKSLGVTDARLASD
ncbi:MAG: septal ring lytic transglycosylase RlpA family protein [Xanthomonadaceae bacterium]|nr:septal ring lytic transglycosylase RlpA family protein [Xanthomonadaceae bacterium]